MTADDNRRHHFRIEYPSSSTPQLDFRGQTCSVVELSEGGGRIHGSEIHLAPDATAVGTLQLVSGEALMREFELLRSEADMHVIRFTSPLDFSTIMAEQRWLIARYGKDFMKPAQP